MKIEDWVQKAADDILLQGERLRIELGAGLITSEIVEIIQQHCPFKPDRAYIEVHTAPTAEGPLLQCIECHNTESPSGAMARHWNHGRCMHCGGYFKVTRA